MNVIDHIWAVVGPTTFLSREDFERTLEGWRIVEHATGGTPAGAVLTRGPELHFVTYGTSWVMTRADLRTYLCPLLAEFGHVITKTPKDDTRQQRFNRILGFRITGTDEFFITYRLDQQGSKLCQQ